MKCFSVKSKDKLQAEKVLDYWFALEFFAQDKYPDSRDVESKVAKHKRKRTAEAEKRKTIENFIYLNANEDIYERIAKEAVDCGMKKWGNLTVYIGKVKRERCIACISEKLPFDQEDEIQPEKSTDKIAWISLQLSPEGNYMEHSLSLSTIIWALNQIKSAQNNISDFLDEELYNEAVEALEKKIFQKDSKISVQQDIEKEGELQRFSPDAVSMKELYNLYKEIEKNYIKGNIESIGDEGNAYEEVYGFRFQMFADEKTKNKKEDDNYLGLTHDYYSNDIRLILEKIRSGDLDNDNYMEKDILKYITVWKKEAAYKDKRIDLIHPDRQGKREYLKQINEILAVKNAPLGKWPSRFMPALMQQIAVNLAIGKGKTELYGMNGSVFSVNGPPGTGKTTLLKEIVVNNIVERAILLSEYSKPDDAFTEHDFLHGEACESAYSKYTRHWYSLKNEDINNYGMLVTSCNNAAVENISKELPKSMLGDLAPLENDSDELKELLAEVRGVFNAEESDTVETTYKGEEYKDVYFTKYAEELLDNKEVWGLVAAPLGKKTNIKNFYDRVLYSLDRDFYKSKSSIMEREGRYTEAVKKFKRQLEVVRQMQAALGKIGTLVEDKIKVEEDFVQIQQQGKAKILQIQDKIWDINQSLGELGEREKEWLAMVTPCEKALYQQRLIVEEKENEIYEMKCGLQEAEERELKISNECGILTKLFNKTKYQAAMDRVDVFREETAVLRENILKLQADAVREKERLNRAEELWKRMKQEYEECKERIADLKKRREEEEKNISVCETEITRAARELKTVQRAYASEIAKYADAEMTDSSKVIDENFIEQLLSKDIKRATDAQVTNPWFTQRYNREREKLFGYAVRLNKEFVVSSRCCRDNLKTLAQYWGLRPGDENEKIIFHREDRENMVPALFQTLLLLVPVISSTFASVGKLLKDIKRPGVIGMLIVDEAGQAQPQMALGALYRSRRAMIVGDPKQVEPVVTDDLTLLKKAYSDEELKPYKGKTLSVQGFADQMNLFGTYFDNGSDYPEWVGCPLVVHRRCISPMYDISNEISYNGMMKQQTKLPKPDKIENFIFEKSQWINVKGREKGDKNHFVEAQGAKVCELLEIAFSKNSEPSIYIISPFTTVVSGIKDYIKRYCRKNNNETTINCDYILDYEQKRIGTVHTFQGKEADEVIFLLGCDTSEGAKGAIRWVNKNIVNVAATRAKYRLYVIGDEEAWRNSDCVRRAKEIMDTFAIKKIKSILEADISEQERQKELMQVSGGLPSITSFATLEADEANGEVDFSMDTSGLIEGLNEDFLKTDLSPEQLEKFGWKDKRELDALPERIRENLYLGMKLFFLLKPVYALNSQLDASCCAILFCKAMELQMKECFLKGLQDIFPDFKIRGNGKNRNRIALKEARKEEVTLGTFQMILKCQNAELGRRMREKGKTSYDEAWWHSFENKLGHCRNQRNQCCHDGLFTWRNQSFLLFDMFMEDTGREKRTPKIGGLIFESEIGKAL